MVGVLVITIKKNIFKRNWLNGRATVLHTEGYEFDSHISY